jgi:MEDS: MEthanogen/methylotroph, DcmR Sensory domain/Histidine kinase-like ATPase domain
MTEPIGRLLPDDHEVIFYDHDVQVVGEVVRFVREGLAAGERVVVLATPEHRAAIAAQLLSDRPRLPERYLALDAADMLATFMVNGAPDADTVRRNVGAIVDGTASGAPVRVFGEMVALLWEQGNVTGALQLETLWNELARSHRFSLRCAYPMSALHGATLTDATRVCDLHSHVSPPHSYDRGTSHATAVDAPITSEIFLPVPAAVPAARRFVAATLSSWGQDTLVDDARLITSELATNSVNHGGSAFRVRMDHAGDSVRISIQDIALGGPSLIPAEVDADRGRGVGIVEVTASSWGCDVAGEGKEVWAELGLPAP